MTFSLSIPKTKKRAKQYIDLLKIYFEQDDFKAAERCAKWVAQDLLELNLMLKIKERGKNHVH